MKPRQDMTVHMIPIDQIVVVNSRSRGKEKFRQIAANISSLGLKKPVTVARRSPKKDGTPQYELACGEGRIEAYKLHGQTEIPALIVDATREELMLMSLAENIARRQRTSLEMSREIAAMQERGHKPADIAKLVDLDVVYVRGLLKLLRQGERQLITAVEGKRIPLSIAMMIAESPEHDVQRAMTEAYDNGQLRGTSLRAARRLLAKRMARRGQRSAGAGGNSGDDSSSAGALLKAFKQEAARQRMLVGRARQCEVRLRFVVSAMKRLLADEALVTLFRAEGLVTLPQYLAAQLNGKGATLGA